LFISIAIGFLFFRSIDAQQVEFNGFPSAFKSNNCSIYNGVTCGTCETCAPSVWKFETSTSEICTCQVGASLDVNEDITNEAYSYQFNSLL